MRDMSSETIQPSTSLENKQSENCLPLTTFNIKNIITTTVPLNSHILNKTHQAKLNWWNKPLEPVLTSGPHREPHRDKNDKMNEHKIEKPENNFIDNHQTNNTKALVQASQDGGTTSYSNGNNMSMCSPNVIFSHRSVRVDSEESVAEFLQNCDAPTHKHNNYNLGEQISQDSELLLEDKTPCFGILNPNQEDEMKITGYARSTSRTFLCWLCICLTGGLLRLVLHWWSHWYLIATHKLCPLETAEKVLIQESYQGKHTIYYVKKVINLDAELSTENDSSNENYDDRSTKNLEEKNVYLSIHFTSGQFKAFKTARLFTCKQLRYAWDHQSQTFVQLKGLDSNVSSEYFHHQKGLPKEEQLARRSVYGLNEISVPYKSVKTLLFLEVLNPFYVFQIFSVVLWFTYSYYYYACVIVLMSVFGITMSIRQTKKNQDSLRDTVQNTGNAFVLNEKGEVSEIPTQRLVPGDIIEIPPMGCTMQCDAVLLTGNCILDESMLTGESVPITKTPLPLKREIIFDKKEHARHTLFCGTKVIQTRNIGSQNVIAIVINTGNITAKGGLIRSILYPPPVDYKFEKDSYKFIECLALIACVGFVYTLITKIMRGIDPVKIAVESLDLITIVVPPALPAAMSVGRYYAQKRLERNSIYCISPRSINVAGSINCCCFDKTGTLTEDGLDMWGVVPKSATNQFQIPIKQVNRLPNDNFLFGMVTCHSISIMNGKLMGDPLDLKMFESTGWEIEDTKNIPDVEKYGLMHPTVVRQPKKAPDTNVDYNERDDPPPAITQRQSSVDDLLADAGVFETESNNDHGIVREFPFTSNLQRMSVITRRLCEKNFNVYCKGSPEMLQQLCQPDSLPDNYSQQLSIYAKQGYRVIALAYKSLSKKMNYTKAQRITRESVESDLEFLGFVVMENRLKPDTTDVIRSLTSAHIRTVMVTGDNILTAISVARDCGIVTQNQSVITVNTRQLEENEHSRNSVLKNKYELYYTLELGIKEEPVQLEKNGKEYTCYSINGDLASLSSASHLPYSSSLTSVKTCDTWTHNDVEMDSESCISKPPLSLPNSNSWRKDYRFAMVGKTWEIARLHFPDQMKYFLTRGSVFARMSPEQKQELIIELQGLDYSVAMCGDGANDCGALKVANAGISLSETESSIASPFTSRNSTIACVPNVIKEGRAALVTSFGIFKYMAAYSMVQFISVMILYSIDSNLTDKQYLYIDLGLISVFAFFFGKTESFDGNLVKQVPLTSLISPTPLSSIALHLLVVVLFQLAGWLQLHQQDWFEPFNFGDEDHLGCWENYTLFAISSFQYIILAFVFSKSKPYRKPIWSNVPFCLSIVINVCIVFYLILYPTTWIADFFQLVMPPVMDFRYWMLIYGCVAFCFHVFVESFLVEFLILNKYQEPRESNVQTTKQQHIHIENDLRYLTSWPPISEICEAFKNTADSDVMPTYSNIKAEQAFELPTDNALAGFFETPPHTENS